MIGFVLPGLQFDVPIEVVVLGVISGLTYSLLGVGLTLIYRSSRVLNFAHGEMGALPALAIPILVLNYRWPYWPALLVTLAGSAAVGALVEFLVFRRLRGASRLTVLVATIGVAQLLFVAGALLPKGGELTGRSYPTPFEATVRIGDLILGPGQLMIVAVVPAVTAALALFLRRSKLGRASRAAADNAEAAQLAGVPVARVSLAIWVIAGLLAGLSAILIGPTRPLAISEALGPALMLRALGAAMLGGLTGFVGVFAAGIAIGIVEALTIWNYPIGGVLDVVLFLIILGSLLVKKGLGQLARGSRESTWALAASLRPLDPRLLAVPAVRWARRLGIVVLLVLAAFLPTGLTSSEQFFMGGVVLFALIGLSLVVLTGFAGQVSLGQFAFVGVGAAVGGRIHQLGWPHPVGAAVAIAVGGALAVLIGIPALRIRGLFLAVATLALSVATSSWLFFQSFLVHRSEFGESSLQLPRPVLFGQSYEREIRYYWICLAALVVVAVAVHRLRRSGLGRTMIAVRDNEPSAASLAISPRAVKLRAFAISGMIAAFAGFLYGGLIVNFSSDPGSTFGPGESLSLVVMTVLGGITTVSGAVLGALWVQGLPRLLGEEWGILTSGVGLIVVLLLLPGGLASLLFTLRDRAASALAARFGGEPEAEAAPTAVPVDMSLARRRPDAVPADTDVPPLEATGVTVRYGGLIAVNNVSIVVRDNEIVGLMGPNGAGKTTLFDVLSGLQRPTAGTVRLHGVDVTGEPPYKRARMGLGRSFQQARLFEDLTLLDAVQVALEHDMPSRSATSVLGLPGARRRDRARREAAAAVLTELGLREHLDRRVAELSTGMRRMAEVACVSALGARVLLLDEPTAGFNSHETEQFADVIRRLRDERGLTIVVIDHDVPMMRTLVDRLYVLAIGRVIAEGSPDVLSSDEGVLEAYMGVVPEGAESKVAASLVP